MIHSDAENKRWWDGLSKQGQIEILATMVDKSYTPDFAISISEQYEEDRPFSPKQLAAIRKWAP